MTKTIVLYPEDFNGEGSFDTWKMILNDIGADEDLPISDIYQIKIEVSDVKIN